MEEKFWKDHSVLLNKDEENELEIFGYKTQGCRKALCIAGYILSCGALLLLFYWKPEWDVWANCTRCSLEEADVVLLRTTDEFQRYTRKKVTWIDLATLALPVGSNSDGHLVADKDSVINRAVMKPQLKVRCIQVQKIRYIWDFSVKEFKKVGSLEDSNTCHSIHHKFGAGLTREEQKIRQLVCGPNAIEVEIRPIWKLLFKEILNPFYVFQAFTLTLWLSQGYIEYSVAIIILSIISVGLTVYDLRQQSTKLHDLVEEHNKVQVTVCTKSEGCKELESRYLVPGDMFLLDGKKLSLPCDAVLIDGNCIVNEGMLTGESIPVTKTPLPLVESPMPWKTHSMEDYRRHVLFCGTEVIQTKAMGRGPARAVVLQTGFNTAKGDLVRSILYPKPVNFKLYRDAFKFIVGLSAIGVFGLIYTVCVFVSHKKPVADVVAMALLLLTVAVPPTIPAALTTGTVYAQRRLKKKKIFCISPERINICGQINLVCFDKTGTLTEDGLDLWGIIPSEGRQFQKIHKFPSSAPLPWGPVCGAMASCHSLVVLDKKIQGDPLDVKMFEGTHWEIDDSSTAQDGAGALHTCVVRPGPKASSAPTEGIVILHQFPFSSGLQRMSVVSQKIGEEQYDLYMKGAPEIVSSFCRPETVPADFLKELKTYTSQGFRVIALAHKVLNLGKDVDLSNVQREEAESGLVFLGLLVMENRLKQDTKPVLQELAAARIRSVMVTGDNLQTAVTVARNADMIHMGSKVILIEANEPEGSAPASITWRLAEESKANTAAPREVCANTEEKITLEGETCDYHFAMNGKSYQVIIKHFYSLLPKILVNATVFARMSPGQKSSLVEEFQKLNYYVGMCGDGANDCGALKMAHAGISLSEQEASVASPFTSQIPNIQCVPELIREGRAALVASFAVVKYLTLYGLIQFVGTALLFWQLQIFGIHQYLIQDVVITLLVCLTMSLTEAYPKLAPYRPPGQLISPPLLLSIILNVCFTIIMQTCGFLLVKQQRWYVALASQRHCSLGNGTVSSTSPGGNGTSSGDQSTVLSYEDSTLWPLSSINCIIVAFVFSKGKPFRKPIYTNYVFSVLLALQLAVCLFLFLADIDAVYSAMQFLCTPVIWRVYILLMLLATFCISFFTEDVILQNKRLWMLLKAWFGYQSKSQYRKWQRMLQRDPNWPPVNGKDFAAKSTDEIYINPTYEHNDEE
ncbi:PREDICTED: probable cation-transporting ATPase 13A5 [Charadrius vociferus]|uniref:probable cation-transporting ATPase 13A5 n=1 Tax=Charadrius vociferus TaxID=50402 RepID=UPI0005214553|nr:PREDICTED: probable cation-transporting ATPase 13A5 [Charadrius vociferus]